MNDGYRFEITCAKCGGQVEHVASGKPASTETRAVVKCTKCSATWVLLVSMLLTRSHLAEERTKYRRKSKAKQ